MFDLYHYQIPSTGIKNIDINVCRKERYVILWTLTGYINLTYILPMCCKSCISQTVSPISD